MIGVGLLAAELALASGGLLAAAGAVALAKALALLRAGARRRNEADRHGGHGSDAADARKPDRRPPRGIKVSVEIKDVEIPSDMQRAMARQAEAERNPRARVINAEAEFQAAEKIYDASEIIARNPSALQLRYLQTLTDLGVNQNTTIVFPLPIELMRGFAYHSADGR